MFSDYQSQNKPQNIILDDLRQSMNSTATLNQQNPQDMKPQKPVTFKGLTSVKEEYCSQRQNDLEPMVDDAKGLG